MKNEIEITDRAFRPAEFRASSLNAEARTVNVVWSTGSPVKRFDWRESEYYLEALEMSTAAVNLDRLNGGAAPFLDNHARGGMADRLGAIVPGSARVEGGQGIATVVLSTSRSGQQIIDDLGHGLPLPVSVGYSVESYQRTEGEGDALPTLLATRWTPMEISAVLVPADPDAQARHEPAEAQRQTVPVTNRRAKGAAGHMEKDTMTTTVVADPVAAERQRSADISLIGANHHASPGLIKRALEGNMTVPQFREAILDEMRARQDRNPIFSIAPQEYQSEAAPLAERMADALLGRLQPRHKVTTGRDFVGASLGEMARHSLEQAGVNTRGMSTGQVIERASMHSTSDLPVMLDTVANRILRDAYAEQPSGLREAAKEQTARDFRMRFSIGLDLAGKLAKVNEHGEFRRLTINEGAEGYALATYGGVFAVTRQALINENLGYFAEMPAHFGKLAARLEAEQLTKLLLGAQTLSDGVAVYHATHGNLLTAAGLSTASLAAARLAMRRQKGAAGEVINIAPKFLVVPPELELLGEQTLAVVNAEKVSDTNPFAGRLTLIVENNLEDARAWYVLADQGASGLEYAYLEGEKGVQLMSRVGFDVDGQEWKARLDFGAGWVDYRGAVKNPGVAP